MSCRRRLPDADDGSCSAHAPFADAHGSRG